MSVTIDSNGVLLTGDGFGVNWARKQLVAAPANTVKMQIVLRPYFTTEDSTSEQFGAKGWDACSFLGLGFDNVIYDFAAGNTIAPTNFFGQLVYAKPNLSGTYYGDRKLYCYVNTGFSETWAGAWGQVNSHTQPAAFTDGHSTTKLLDTYGINVNGNQAALLSYPSNPTEGAKATYMWEVWGSSIDKAVYARLVKDYSSLAEGDLMFGAMAAATVGTGNRNIREFTIHADVTSNWRNVDNTMNFPRWLKFKYGGPDNAVRLKYFKVRYLSASNVVLGEG